MKYAMALILSLLPAFVTAQQLGYEITRIDIAFSRTEDTFLYGLNEFTEIVGYHDGISNPAPYLIQGSVRTPIHITEDPYDTEVFGVNNELKMVGSARNIGAFYKHGDTIQFLTHPKGVGTYAFGLQNRGKTDTLIVGSWSDNTTERAYLLTRFKTWEKVEPKGSVWSRAYGASGKNGVMVSGWYYDADWVSHGFLYNRTSKKFLTLDVPGALETSARGMNDHGHVVGSYRETATGPYRGFLWDGTDYWAIDVEGAKWTFPHDVNNSGHVVGSYTDGDEEQHTWRGFLATPIQAVAAQ